MTRENLFAALFLYRKLHPSSGAEISVVRCQKRAGPDGHLAPLLTSFLPVMPSGPQTVPAASDFPFSCKPAALQFPT